MRLPDKPSLDGIESAWAERWEAEGTYRFDRSRPRADVYAIDTPPPTVSGSLHVGHVFSYTHTDIVARYQRMRGRAVFYPMGWDDNGLPTERRVQNHYGVRCDPSLPYDPAFTPPPRPGGRPVPISRPNFIALCAERTAEDEQAYERLWRRLGLSVDWSLAYATIGERSRRVSQRAFLRLLGRGLAYQAEAPTLWDVDFRTAVAQAELEDREVAGAWYRLRFQGLGGAPALEVETSRPELLPACVALVAHPDDPRYRALVGQTVRTPLFGADVPVLAHELADPGKGTGVAMVCTFGDVTDVLWWRELRLPVRPVIGADGTIRRVGWGSGQWRSADAAAARRAGDELAGLAAEPARARVAELLRAAGALVGEPRPVIHAVKFYEKGDRPLEILTNRQWFIRTLDLRGELLERGRALDWHPAWMRGRYESWVEGLNTDWAVSRQRFFGVPFPVWYPVRADGTVDHGSPILPPEARLPVDPSSDAPDGFEEAQRGRPGGFVGDPDVMDTWATSSLTPQIAGGWDDDPDLFARVFPMDLRPQSHEIIRTWLFSTVVRSHLEHGALPWAHVAISGWVVDPDRKKLSKSKGNAVTPVGLLDQYGSDAVRHWAASARPGVDTVFDEAQLRVGRRLAIKLLNASRFILATTGPEAGAGDEATAGTAEPVVEPVAEPLDAAMLAGLAEVVDAATAALEGYDYTTALERVEAFFWRFCDDYLELVKSRAYGDGSAAGRSSAARSLRLALSVVVRLFAPVLPFAAEEVWSWWRQGSVHRAAWPSAAPLRAAAGPAADPAVLDVAAAVLAEVRKAKSLQRRSMRWPVESATVHDTAARLDLLRAAEGDVRAAGRIAALAVGAPREALLVEVALAGEPGA